MLTVATWNVENLFTPDAEAGPTDASAYDAKLQALATTIGDVDADVGPCKKSGNSRRSTT